MDSEVLVEAAGTFPSVAFHPSGPKINHLKEGGSRLAHWRVPVTRVQIDVFIFVNGSLVQMLSP